MTEERFETRLARVRAIVERLEAADVPLEEGIRLFQEGMDLCRQLSQELEQARLVIEEATRQEGQ